jgi:hypothetical protein
VIGGGFGYDDGMHPFNPWTWPDPAVLVGGYDLPDAEQRDRTEPGRTEDDRGIIDLVGYDVEATDGGIGSIDEASHETGAGFLIVDTGPWIFGRKVLLPAGTVQRVDHTARTVYVDRTKDQIRNAPEYDKDTFGDPGYRDRVGRYYGETYR